MTTHAAIRNLNAGLASVIDERAKQVARAALDALPVSKPKRGRPPTSAEYRRGFAAGVASTNTERAELRAQVEALTARLRALTPKKGRGEMKLRPGWSIASDKRWACTARDCNEPGIYEAGLQGRCAIHASDIELPENDADHEAALAFERGARSRDTEVADLRERIAAVEEANVALTARLNAKNADLLASRILLQDAVDAATPLLTDAHALAMLKGVVLAGVERLNHADMRMARRSCEDVIPGEQLLNVAANLSMVVAQAVDDLRGGEKTDPMRGRAGA